METVMQNNTENSPLTHPIMKGRSPDYTTGLEGSRLELRVFLTQQI